MRTRPIAAGLVLAALTLAGCADSHTAAGCTPPPHEPGLLDAYAADPIFDVRPPDAPAVQAPARTVACRVEPDWPDDPSETAVSQMMQTAVEYDTAALSKLYDRVATSQGWRPVPVDRPAALRYCRQVRGVTSYLSISSATPRPQAGVGAPDGVTRSVSPPAVMVFHYLSVRIAAAPEQRTCPAG